MQRPSSSNARAKLDVIKFKDGEEVTGVAIGDIHTYYVIWNGKYFQSAERGTPSAKFRFRINFAVKDGAGWTLRVLEGGQMLYNSLYDLNEEFPIDSNMIKVKRKGSGQNDTEYSAMLAGKVKFAKEDAAYLATLKPYDLRLEDELETAKFESATGE